MSLQTEDRRVRRTRKALHEALIGLILDKPYDDITVGDITERANVGRSTFYAHFDNKEDLFLSSWQMLLDHLMERIDWSEEGGEGFLPVAFLFGHAREYHTFFQALLASDKAGTIFETGIPYLSNRLERELSQREKTGRDGGGDPVPLSLLAHHLASGLFGLLRWWLQQGMPYSPQRMDDLYHELYVTAWLHSMVKMEP